MKVKDVMTSNPLVVSSNTSINEVRTIFSRVPFWSIYIADAGKLAGIVTRNDLKFRAAGKNSEAPVSEIMSTGVHKISPNEDVAVAISMLRRLRINGLAVVENNRLCGIITYYDIRTRHNSVRGLEASQYGNTQIDVEAGNEVGRMVEKNSEPETSYKPFTENVGFWDRILLNTDQIFWKKTMQSELDKRWVTFDSSMQKLDSNYEVFKKHHMEITEEGKNLDTTKEEWAESLRSLGNLLNKNSEHERQMWDITQKTNRSKGIKIKQKFKDSDVDEIRFNNMMDYIKQYPELQNKSTINHLLGEVKDKRNEVLSSSKAYQGKIKEANVYLNTAKKNLQKVEDELDAFEAMKKEGEDKVKDVQAKGVRAKVRGILDTLTSRTAAEKQYKELNFFEYDRKINVSRNQLKLIKNDLKDYEERTFKPIVTKKFEGIE